MKAKIYSKLFKPKITAVKTSLSSDQMDSFLTALFTSFVSTTCLQCVHACALKYCSYGTRIGGARSQKQPPATRARSHFPALELIGCRRVSPPSAAADWVHGDLSPR